MWTSINDRHTEQIKHSRSNGHRKRMQVECTLYIKPFPRDPSAFSEGGTGVGARRVEGPGAF